MAYKQETQLIDIQAPCYDELERQVLSDAVLNPDVIGDMARIITRDMFTSDDRTHIWDVLLSMFNSGDTIDAVSVHAKVGQAYLNEVLVKALEVSTPVGALAHASLLRDSASRRRTYFAALRLLKKSVDPALDEGGMLSAMEQAAGEIRGRLEVRGEKHISDIVNEIADEVQETRRLAERGMAYRTPTGFRILDGMMLGGWAPGQLIILAARPSVGKTAVMLQMAKVASASGFPSIVFSAELPETEIGKRLMYSTNHINSYQVASGNMDWDKFERASGILSNLPLYVNDSCVDISDACARVVLAAKRGECRIAFFDYLTRFSINTDARTPLYQKIGLITKMLANTAKRARIPIILLCQLTRDSAKENRAPQLYDLRESGDIEQDADIVLMMDTRGESMTDPPEINMWVRKNRQGEKEGCIVIRPSDSYTSFDEVGTE